jgi:hypothetical protein
VTHVRGTATVTANQKQNGGAWVPLGAWSFAPSSGHKMTLAASADGTTIADALLFVAAGSQPANLLYVHPDHRGAPQKLTDATQAIVWDGLFDPFGEEVGIAGLAAMPLRFPGQYADEETGYSYNYFRDHEPTLGRGKRRRHHRGAGNGGDDQRCVSAGAYARPDSKHIAVMSCS